ncbi:amino acid dehydrogenase [Catenulispora sp. NF23]|uniref:Glu/Leu/Phe/Val dehydrogenase dimerization domain-containing protein n=1 Tax=Catenulispora pinistramenti TaxID=2705254 RepID=UPI001BA7F80A|nr:Glu/Leu/Phe/Val dehydrogenase dimerization domain-containing protein [Catenulispora pinistramenti]MBS2535481.1 amino acid dehydrogenase [Catenulispora pinistramenti]
MPGSPQWPHHESVVTSSGARTGLPVIIAVHSSVLGPAAGGCRIWRYPRWQDGLEDALRLSAAMTAKFAAAGLACGGGKTVVALPEGYDLTPDRRHDLLSDIGDAVEALDGRYATAPDVGTSTLDMVVIGERTSHVFCKPTEHGGSGDSSPATADGTLAALRAVGARLGGGAADGTGPLRGLRLAVIGLGNVGSRLAELLSEAGAELVLSDIDAGKRELADRLGATWAEPHEALTAEVDIVVPAALGGVLTEQIVPELRCRAVVGPANNQLAVPQVADSLQTRGIVWVPDHIASAGGVIHAVTVELDKRPEDEARQRVRGIEHTVAGLLQDADSGGVTVAAVTEELVRARLGTPDLG